ncbi:RNF213 [Mytilus coruscus]|uniref:RNF213 n=1 Tax=Mytilus coruscus TaxID=42192 RepID=A0A6J8CP85_MYTCO|nr:RNF213 [Mytilus coruscus]
MLVKWFDNTFLFKKQSIQSDTDKKIKAVILGLAVCYHSRFSDGIIRRKYREEIKKCIWSTMSYAITEEEILDSILTEQKYILNMMTELPAGTALNAALQENVFMLLVCILNKIPIFLVGKPGCSKSLSMQLIRSNLRGKDSTSHLFQEMPQLFCVSFQGSESSTSDGIIKVFEKAEKYQKHNDERDVLSVVILDEIGLAEISKFNPLKVLHGLIERHDEQIKVAVVGISNWALDAAKMNRAIHLSRPDMDLGELIYTGKSISNSMMPSKENAIFDLESSLDDNFGVNLQPLTTQLLEGIAKAYHEYCLHDQKFPNFHGLRDFYSLIKYLGRKEAVYQNADDEEI